MRLGEGRFLWGLQHGSRLLCAVVECPYVRGLVLLHLKRDAVGVDELWSWLGVVRCLPKLSRGCGFRLRLLTRFRGWVRGVVARLFVVCANPHPVSHSADT